MTTTPPKISRDQYLNSFRRLWSHGPADLALKRGQISPHEHRAILEFIDQKTLVRKNAALRWTVSDAEDLDVAEITQRRDGTFLVRALIVPIFEPVLFTSEDQCYLWIDQHFSESNLQIEDLQEA
jgi:hypothetical protein